MLRHDISNVFLDCDKQTITTHAKNTECLFHLCSRFQYKTKDVINRFHSIVLVGQIDLLFRYEEV